MHGRRGMLHVALELLQAHGLADVERRKLTGRGLGKEFRREPAGQLVARGRETSVPAVVDDAALRWLLLRLTSMLAVAVLLLLLLLPEVGRKLLHVLVADGALLLLLLALGEKLLQLGVHLLLLGLGRLLVVVGRLLLRRLMGAQDGVAAAALLLLLELLHLLLEFQVGGEGHLGQRGRVGRLLLLLLLGWLRGVVSSFQNRPSLRLRHLWHLLLLLLTRMRLLQIPRNVTARHARLLLLLPLRSMITPAAPGRSLLLLVGHWRHSDRIRMMTHSRMWRLLLLVGNLRRRALHLRHRRRRRMLSHEGTQISLLLLGETGGGVVEAQVSEDVLLVDATIFSVDGGIADGRGKLFVFFFGGHLAEHGGWREG